MLSLLLTYALSPVVDRLEQWKLPRWVGAAVVLREGQSASERELRDFVAGKLADFVVLEKDPHDVDPDQIMNIKVNRTVVGGKTVYGG